MKALHLTAYGNPAQNLRMVEVLEPNAPSPRARLLCAWSMRRLPTAPLLANGVYLLNPKLSSVIGGEGAGIVEAIGRESSASSPEHRQSALKLAHCGWLVNVKQRKNLSGMSQPSSPSPVSRASTHASTSDRSAGAAHATHLMAPRGLNQNQREPQGWKRGKAQPSRCGEGLRTWQVRIRELRGKRCQ